jgi:exo-beta-1,3-glucanase (GH17 family)
VGSFARRAVERYAPMGVHTFEVGNELNYEQSAGAYTADLCAAASQIRSADPKGFVLASGMGPSDSPWPVDFLERMYEAGAKDCMDAANMHPYSFPDQPMRADDWNSFSNLPKLHQVMVDHGDGAKKIWLTEYGAPTFGNPTDNRSVSESEQARMISGAFAQVKQWSWAGPLFVFDWVDSRDGAFGLLRSDGSAKPAYSALVDAAH